MGSKNRVECLDPAIAQWFFANLGFRSDLIRYLSQRTRPSEVLIKPIGKATRNT